MSTLIVDDFGYHAVDCEVVVGSIFTASSGSLRFDLVEREKDCPKVVYSMSAVSACWRLLRSTSPALSRSRHSPPSLLPSQSHPLKGELLNERPLVLIKASLAVLAVFRCPAPSTFNTDTRLSSYRASSHCLLLSEATIRRTAPGLRQQHITYMQHASRRTLHRKSRTALTSLCPAAAAVNAILAATHYVFFLPLRISPSRPTYLATTRNGRGA
ncbi:hypothetical protein BDQ17DRAFT_1427808 [Cyathus striatus]|nr:hypothetical protein BDQ17DRAFT_1427808 [Cyathus striatus]